MFRFTFLHVSERWVAEAVWAQWVTLATGSRRPQHKLKVIQRTAELFVQLDGSVLGKTVGLITVGAVEPAGLCLQIRVRKQRGPCSHHHFACMSSYPLTLWELTGPVPGGFHNLNIISPARLWFWVLPCVPLRFTK